MVVFHFSLVINKLTGACQWITGIQNAKMISYHKIIRPSQQIHQHFALLHMPFLTSYGANPYIEPHRHNIGRIVGVHFELNKPQRGPMKLCLHYEHLGYLYRSNYKRQISHQNGIVKKRLTASFFLSQQNKFCHGKSECDYGRVQNNKVV